MSAAVARFLRAPIESTLDPWQVLDRLRGRSGVFALTGSWAGGGAILGTDPLLVAGPDKDPFGVFDQLPRLASRDVPGDAVGGGWFGWLGYGAGARIESLPPQPPRPHPLPETRLAYHDSLLRLDRDGRWWFEALVAPDREAALNRRQEEFRRLLVDDAAGRNDRPEFAVPREFRPVAPGGEGHLAAVARCRERIAAGEFFQANLRVRFEGEWEGDLADLFVAAAGKTRPAFGALFVCGEGGVASLSPELFLRRRGDTVETAPIKGTSRRPDDPAAAERARVGLASSAKDAAEHMMIVDVARNDLGRVCSFGTVEAPAAPEAEPHPGVWHLVSRVRGRLAPGIGDADLLRATFPPCSVTGAPKIQAMRAIAELEPLGREVFTGAIGFASPAAGLELSVAIRTFEAAGGRIWLDAGGGIVADSDPERELEECLAKARPLIEATGSRTGPAGLPARKREPRGARWALDGSCDRPDPGRGLLETIRVEGGRPVRVEWHLDRMARSLQVLFGTAPPDDLAVRIAGAATEIGNGAIRVTAGPGDRFAIARRDLPDRRLPVRLAPVILPGGLGEHKWADRRLVNRLAEPGPAPLLVDLDGTVLEASWGNIWIVEDGRLLTPPADGRILPGISRRGIVAAGSHRGIPVREEGFSFERLAAADRVMVSSSLAGLVPAGLTGPDGGTAEGPDR